MRGSTQKRRSNDFFTQNFNPESAKQMSEICLHAHIIYDIWDGGKGTAELYRYLLDEVECSEYEAKVICDHYNPKNPPQEVCPVDTLEKRAFREVFPRLALQLPSVNEGDGVWPKNLLAWVLKRKVHGSDVFDFEIRGIGHGHDNTIYFPNLINGPDGNPIPFGLAALDAIKVGELPAHAVKKAEIFRTELGDVGIRFAKMLLDADFIFPPRKVVRQLAKVIKRGFDGETVVLSGAFCPDYAYRESTTPGVKYEYTFDSVGSGIGLVAQQFVRVLPFLTKFFKQNGIKYRIKLGIGDFEANSQEILHSVKVTRDEFIAHCLMSLEAFRQKFPNEEMELALFEQHWANGRWNNYINEATRAMLKGYFGNIKANTEKDPRHEIAFIARDSASFYRRWYNKPEMELDEIAKLVIAQGAEYVAMGCVLKDDFGNEPFIQIAGDRPKMQMFNSFASNHPTLCCKRIY